MAAMALVPERRTPVQALVGSWLKTAAMAKPLPPMRLRPCQSRRKWRLPAGPTARAGGATRPSLAA